jgi:DNA polymerase/3'-5' exonuclease PolX
LLLTTVYSLCFCLSAVYFTDGNKNAGGTYIKIVKVISDFDFAITEENALGLGKGKTKIAGVGKASAEKMLEFCQTGTMQKLEEKRANHA